MSNFRQAKSEGKDPISAEITYRDLFQRNPQAMWVYEVDTLQILDVNDAAASHYGYTREEFLLLTRIDLRPEADIPLLEQALQNVREHENGHSTGIYRHKKKDGTVIYVTIQSNIIYVGGRKAELVLSSDITEKRKPDEKFKAIFEHTRDAIIITDDEGCCLDYNEAAVALFGYSRQALNRKSLFDILMFREDQNPRAVWCRFLEGEILNGTMQLLHIQGNVIVGSFNAQPNILPGMHLCIITDVTERIEKKRQLIESERRFKALVQEGADLIGILDVEGIAVLCLRVVCLSSGMIPIHCLGKILLTLFIRMTSVVLLLYLPTLKAKGRSGGQGHFAFWTARDITAGLRPLPQTLRTIRP